MFSTETFSFKNRSNDVRIVVTCLADQCFLTEDLVDSTQAKIYTVNYDPDQLKLMRLTLLLLKSTLRKQVYSCEYLDNDDWSLLLFLRIESRILDILNIVLN
jgi:hypothetical protein